MRFYLWWRDGADSQCQRLNPRDCWNASGAQSQVQASERPFFGFIHMYLNVFGICTAEVIYFFNSAIVNRMGVKLHSLAELSHYWVFRLCCSGLKGFDSCFLTCRGPFKVFHNWSGPWSPRSISGQLWPLGDSCDSYHGHIPSANCMPWSSQIRLELRKES